MKVVAAGHFSKEGFTSYSFIHSRDHFTLFCSCTFNFKCFYAYLHTVCHVLCVMFKFKVSMNFCLISGHVPSLVCVTCVPLSALPLIVFSTVPLRQCVYSPRLLWSLSVHCFRLLLMVLKYFCLRRGYLFMPFMFSHT